MTYGILEALSPVLSLGFFQAMFDSPEEALVAWEEHKTSVESAKASASEKP